MDNQQPNMRIEVITRDCWYAGSVANRGFRVADILNDGTVNTLTMYDTVTGIVGVGSANVRWKQVLLRKDRILMVIPKGSYEAPIRRRNNFLAKDQYGAMVVLPGHIVSGIVHLPPRATPLMLMEENSTLPSFVGMTDVTVHNSIHKFPSSNFGVAIVRRQFIEAVQLTAQRLPKREAVAAESGHS